VTYSHYFDCWKLKTSQRWLDMNGVIDFFPRQLVGWRTGGSVR
jgi:hypothetical protein